MKRLHLVDGLLVFFMLLSSVSVLSAQEFAFEMSLGYNDFQITTLREMQNDFIQSLAMNGIHARAIQAFPPYYNMQVGLWYKEGMAGNFGIFADYTSTGGRVAYSDYSGELSFDQVVERRSIGISYERVALTRQSLSLGFSLQGWISWSALRLNEAFTVGDSRLTDEVKTNSSPTLAIQPGIHIALAMGPATIGLRGSYYTEGKKEYRLDSNSDATLMYNSTPVKTEWNSFRIEFVVGITFFRMTK